MTFAQDVLLLTLIGGVIHLTFEISWKMFNSNDRKKVTAIASPSRGHFSDNQVRG